MVVSPRSGSSVLSKITVILSAFTDGTVLSLTEITRHTGLPISTTHRHLSELAALRLLERTQDGRYQVGLSLRRIGAVDARPPSIAERGPWVLEDLSGVTGSRVRLGVLGGLAVSYIEKLPGTPPTAFRPAATLPAHSTALGRVLLAFAPADLVKQVIDQGLRHYTCKTITSAERFRRALVITRRSRVAVIRGEFEENVSTVAMPVFGPGGAILAALEVTLTDHDRSLSKVTGMLSIAARSLSRELSADAQTSRTPRLQAVSARDVS